MTERPIAGQQKNTMKDTLKIIGGVIVAILLVDAFGFMAWIYSGQTPVDNFYIGTITAHVLKLFL
jgi:hypothetical protein